MACQDLVSLDLSNNELCHKSGFYIGRLITKQSEKCNELEWAAGLRGEEANHNPYKLKSINLSKNKLTNIAISDLCSALLFDTVLTSINISNNHLVLECVESIKSLLQSNTHLRSFEILNTGIEKYFKEKSDT